MKLHYISHRIASDSGLSTRQVDLRNHWLVPSLIAYIQISMPERVFDESWSGAGFNALTWRFSFVRPPAALRKTASELARIGSKVLIPSQGRRCRAPHLRITNPDARHRKNELPCRGLCM